MDSGNRNIKVIRPNLLILALIVLSVAGWVCLANIGLLGDLEYNALQANKAQATETSSLGQVGKSELVETINASRGVGLLSTSILALLFTLPVFGFSFYNRRGCAWLGFVSAFCLLLYAVMVPQVEHKMGLALPLFAPIGSALTATAVVLLFRLNQEEKKNRRLQNIFSSYLSPELVNRLLESEHNPQNEGTEVCISMLFSDIENFAGIAHDLPPDQLVKLMGIYLNTMSETLRANGATLDKFVGDGIIAMFGMPVVLPKHAAMACQAALRMQERCAALRREWQASGLWPASVSSLHNRIGVHTGQALVGNFGSAELFNYTMIGDSVNLASRCEAMAKEYGVYTLVSGETLQAACKDLPDLRYRKIDDVVFRGRYIPFALYELWDESMHAEGALACKAAYETALEAYQKGDFPAAIKGFQLAESHEPLRLSIAHTPSSVLLARSRKYLEDGVPPGWKGAHYFELK